MFLVAELASEDLFDAYLTFNLRRYETLLYILSRLKRPLTETERLVAMLFPYDTPLAYVVPRFHEYDELKLASAVIQSVNGILLSGIEYDALNDWL